MNSITRRSRAQPTTPTPGAMDRLVDAFERLLSRGENFTTISVEALAREAGMARATFYLHFRNKGQLVSHAMQAVQLQLKASARARLKKSGSYGRAEFQAFMREVVDILFQHRHAIWAMNEVSAYDPQVQAVFAEFMDQRTREIQRTFDQLARQGTAHPAAHAGLAQMLAWTIERSFCKMLNEQSTPQERAALADMLTHIIWSALADAGGASAD
jgi:AcrR family transcriptional regulator